MLDAAKLETDNSRLDTLSSPLQQMPEDPVRSENTYGEGDMARRLRLMSHAAHLCGVPWVYLMIIRLRWRAVTGFSFYASRAIPQGLYDYLTVPIQALHILSCTLPS